MTPPSRTRLHELYEHAGQSPWLDNLTRAGLRDGTFQHRLDQGVRGVTTNPTTFERAITGSDAYDEQLAQLVADAGVEDAYWHAVSDDARAALDLLRPLYDQSAGTDGYVSVELDPSAAYDADGTIAEARRLHDTIAVPNLMVKVPATDAGIPAIRTLIGEGRNVNVTLIFGLDRYRQVHDAYLDGLAALHERGGDLTRVASVASFFLSRVDTDVDRRLAALGTDAARRLRGRSAVAQAMLAYADFRATLDSDRWRRLAHVGARSQRPLWASTSVKNPNYDPLHYVEPLIGPDTVTTMPEATLDAFADHGTVARTVDAAVDDARATLDELGRLGVDLAEVARRLEADGVASFARSYDHALDAIATKATTALRR
jgi:transaldolase